MKAQKIAVIECPHCGGQIKIRRVDRVEMPEKEKHVPASRFKKLDDLMDYFFGKR